MLRGSIARVAPAALVAMNASRRTAAKRLIARAYADGAARARPAKPDGAAGRFPFVRRFEISAVAFLAFNVVFAFLTLREQRSLLIHCQDWTRTAGSGADCLEPYNFLGLVAIVGAWIVGALALGGVAVGFYLSERRAVLRAAQVV
jgi:hypothetical protein